MRSMLVAAILLVSGLAHAQSPVTASLSSDRAAVGETFYIEVSGEGGDVTEPDMPTVLKDTGIQTGRPTQRMQTNIANINGRVTTQASKTWRYPARATKEGTLTIPRIPVVVDGQERFTLPMQIRITQAAVPSPQGNGADNGGQAVKVEQLAFIESSVDKTSPYQGEGVTLSLRIYAANDYGVQIVGPRTMPMPDTQGFYSGPQQQSNKMETKNGINYRVMEITVVLYPTVSGSLTVQPWSWQGEVNWRDNQFMRPRAVARDFLAPAIPINVQALPDRPADFSGAVGTYRVKNALSTEKLIQGMPVNWTVTVSGEGNPDAIGAPAIPAMTWAHVSGPEIDVQQPANAQEVSKAFRYTLTPLETGEHTLPPAKFVYFAPILKNYKTETTPEVKLSVAASPDAAALVTAGGSRADARSSVEVLNAGLLPIMDAPLVPLRPSVASQSLVWVSTVAGLILPVVLYAAFLVYLRHRRRLTGDPRYARQHFALSRYRESMQRVADSEDPGEALYRALAGYLSDTHNTVEAGLTSQDARELLEGKGAPPEAVTAVVSVLRACERARYAGGRLTREEVDALAAAAEHSVGQLQAGQRKGGRA